MAKAGSEIIDAGRNGEGGGQPSPAAAVDFLLLLQSLKVSAECAAKSTRASFVLLYKRNENLLASKLPMISSHTVCTRG